VDDELEIIKRRKLLELQKRLLEKTKKKAEPEKPDFYSLFLSSLTDDGREMFGKALDQYGDAAARVGESIGRLIYAGRIRGRLGAEEIYWIFREIGMPIRLETRIVYKKRGEVKSISDMLKEE